MVYLTRKERFNAAHKLRVEEWSEEKNRQIFGKCANENWHGHNYKIYVTVRGEPDPVTGFVMDAKKLSDLIRTEITEVIDHKNLNLDVAFMKDIMPTTENLVVAIFNRLKPLITECDLHRVKLEETETIFAEYYG